MTESKKVESNQNVSIEAPANVKKKSSKNRYWLLSLLLLLLLLLMAGGVYLYQQIVVANQDQVAKIATLETLLKKQEKQQSNLSQSAHLIKTTLESELQLQATQIQQLKNESKLNKTDVQSLQRGLAASNVRHPNDWILAEVEYLVSLASRKIWLEGDFQSAIALLFAADQRVVELNDASLSPLRSALLEDINSLEALPKHDPDGVVLTLSSLERRVDKLLVVQLRMPETVEHKETELSGNIDDWQDNLAKSWQTFVDGFIVINKRKVKIEALLSPQQRWYLQENLRNALAKAEFAVYRQQQAIYELALADASLLLSNYYDLNDNATGHFYKSIQRLSKRKISINYPDQLKSAPLLERVIAQRVKKSLASSRIK